MMSHLIVIITGFTVEFVLFDFSQILFQDFLFWYFEEIT